MSVQFKFEPLNSFEQDLHALAMQKAKIYLRSEAELLDVIARVDACKLYLKFDVGSTFAYCVKMLKLSEAVTYNFINVARKTREVPALKTAIEAGELSVPTARKIVPVLTRENCGEWIAKAKELPRALLEREVAQASPHKSAQSRARALPNGWMLLEIPVPPELYEEFLRLQDLVSQSVSAAADYTQTLAAAVLDSLNKRDPIRKAQRNKHNLSMGKSKGIPAAVKHQVNLRDQGRRQARHANGEICGAMRFVHYHHIQPLAAGGEHTVENLITLCSACHRRWHRQDKAG